MAGGRNSWRSRCASDREVKPARAGSRGGYKLQLGKGQRDTRNCSPELPLCASRMRPRPLDLGQVCRREGNRRCRDETRTVRPGIPRRTAGIMHGIHREKDQVSRGASAAWPGHCQQPVGNRELRRSISSPCVTRFPPSPIAGATAAVRQRSSSRAHRLRPEKTADRPPSSALLKVGHHGPIPKPGIFGCPPRSGGLTSASVGARGEEIWAFLSRVSAACCPVRPGIGIRG